MIPTSVILILCGILVGYLAYAFVAGMVQVVAIVAAIILIVLGIIDLLRSRNIIG